MGTPEELPGYAASRLLESCAAGWVGFAIMPINKIVATYAEAIANLQDGAVVMLDGFGGPGGMPTGLIAALRDKGVKDLTIISNTAGLPGFGVPPGIDYHNHAILFENRQVRKVVATFPVPRSGTTPFYEQYRAGDVELELVPQGTLAARIRAGGAGIPAFYTPTGVGTLMAGGKESRVFDGREYLLEHALTADFALLRAHKADPMGNAVYRGTSRNFNSVMASAGRITVLEVDHLVELGDLDPEAVVTPGIYVQRVVQRPAGLI